MNRQQIVERHHPIITRVEPASPLSLGNGEFGFSADFTGLQTFPEHYSSPLGTQSNWGWHHTGGRDVYTDKDIVYQTFETYGRKVPYPMKPEDKAEAYHWLRQNPHRLQLGRISFRLMSKDGREVQLEQVTAINQVLNIWTGVLDSEFVVDGDKVSVTTACHPDHDIVSVKVSSSLVKERRLQVFILFPAPDMTHTSWSKSVFPDFDNHDRHHTKLERISANSSLLHRSMDEDAYTVRLEWSAGQLEQSAVHEFTLQPDGVTDELSFTASFAPEVPAIVPVDVVIQASMKHWASFWMSGAAVDFAGSSDPRAFELERRVILSQYLTAIHSAGSIPPQETGLMYNSWFGKMHLEMHWWHAAHFPIWGRADLLMKSMDWYQLILPKARQLAESQGYSGARWPKMVGFDGEQTPSPVAPGLIWQQPHPMALAELIYQANPTLDILERYQSLVFEAADFMVSYAHLDESRQVYVLGPPLIPAQECHPLQDSMNPPYELEYWKYGLEIAIHWAERMNITPKSEWVTVGSAMAEPPQAEGLYLAHENSPNTYTEKNHDHPSMVAALGILPGTLIDAQVMLNTLLKVKQVWDWESAWGWDFPMCAMTATRLGERELAVDFLLMDATKNTYLPNGHNYQRPGLTAYLPGNGGLLSAVAMMLCGWNGSEDRDCPGFPQDGTWKIEWEGLNPWL